MIGQEPTLVTSAKNADASVPTGEPIASAPKGEPVTLCDPRRLLDAEPVQMAEVKAGDFIRAASWSKPRLVKYTDVQHDGCVLFLAEHDVSRVDEHGIRRVDADGWHERGQTSWVRYPHLTRLWNAAHGDS